jgi:hypothetical protein
MKPTNIKFHFRAESIKDEAGKVIGKSEKRPSVELAIPTIETEDLLAIIEAGGKSLELLLEAANDVIYQAARDVIATAIEDKKELNQALIDGNHANLDWDKIASKPKAERRGSGISKEEWEAFVEDYTAVMAVAQPDKTPEQIATAATHISKKFANCRFNKPVIGTLRGYVATWFANTPNKEDFQSIYETLDNRAETLLNADEAGKLAEAI